MLISYFKIYKFFIVLIVLYKWNPNYPSQKIMAKMILLKEPIEIYLSLMKNWMITFLNLLLKVGENS